MLTLDSLYKSMVRAFGTTTSDDRFTEDFVMAVNNAVDELSVAANLSTRIGHVSSVTENISELDAVDQVVMHAGLTVWLINAGWPHRSPDENFFSRVALPVWRDQIGNYTVKESQDDQSSRSDSGVPLNDIAALGNVSGSGNSGEQ